MKQVRLNDLKYKGVFQPVAFKGNNWYQQLKYQSRKGGFVKVMHKKKKI